MTAQDMYALKRDDFSAPFFDAAARDELVLRRCTNDHWNAPQAMKCRLCTSRELEWAPTEKKGTIVSYAVIQRRGMDPLPVAIVEVNGAWLRGQIQDAGDLSVGQAVEIHFAAPEGGEPLPYFRPKA